MAGLSTTATNTLKALGLLIPIVAACFSAYIFLDNKHAQKEELDNLKVAHALELTRVRDETRERAAQQYIEIQRMYIAAMSRISEVLILSKIDDQQIDIERDREILTMYTNMRLTENGLSASQDERRHQIENNLARKLDKRDELSTQLEEIRKAFLLLLQNASVAINPDLPL